MAGRVKNFEAVLAGVDASRRVGWARCYDAQDEVEVLRGALRELADAIVRHPRVHSQDPVLALAQRCLGL